MQDEMLEMNKILIGQKPVVKPVKKEYQYETQNSDFHKKFS